MDQTIIFSNPTQILHTQLLQNSQIILTTPTQLLLFSLSTAKVIKQYTISQQIMPIQTWVIQKSQVQLQLTNQHQKILKGKDFIIVIQGKMGFNFVFYLCEGQFMDGVKYRTGVCGFCKMVLMGGVVVGVNEEDKAVVVFDVLNGDIKCKALFEQQKLCQSITCISTPTSQPPIISTLYLAQQGCHIHKLSLIETPTNQDSLLEQKESISLPNKNQIKLITNLIEQNKNNRMYCIMRKCPIVYIIGTSPNLCILQSINYQFINPRCLVLIVDADGSGGSDGGSLVVADGNRIVKCGVNGKARVVGQVKQSKNVEYMGSRGRIVYGCTQEKQFFYLQL